jgi:RNA exonuclease 4
MAPELSSNWKRLQVTLKKESTASKEAKSKKVPTERQKNSLAKRKRLEGKRALHETEDSKVLGAIRKRKMGAGGSSQAEAPSATLALWAEDNDISAKDLAEAYGVGPKDVEVRGVNKDSVNAGLSTDVEIGKYVAIDCEMVGVGGDEDRSVLARVSIVNFHGTQVYDSFVKPKEFVTDWRTHVSGVSPKNMATARSFDEVQAEVGELLKGRILIGHAIKNDLEAMMLSHPKRDIRDTSRFSGFRKYSAGRTPSLKKLAKEILGVDIQGGEHSSIEDARATMLLFRRYKSAFDVEHAQKYPQRTTNGEGPSKTKKKKKGKR